MFAFRIPLAAIAFIASLFVANSSEAQEAKTYTYDALGRVTSVGTSGGPANGTDTAYSYDKAGNRVNVTVVGSPNGSASDGGAGNGASLGTTHYIVVPLNGFTIMPIEK